MTLGRVDDDRARLFDGAEENGLPLQRGIELSSVAVGT